MIPFFRLPIDTLAGSRLIRLDSRRLRRSDLITIPEEQLHFYHSLLVESYYSAFIVGIVAALVCFLGHRAVLPHTALDSSI